MLSSRRRREVSSFALESVEARRLMATVPVTNTNDTGAGSLRDAISAANPGDTVSLAGLSGTISLASVLTINKNLTIDGPGSGSLTLSGAGQTTQAINITNDANVSIDGLTFDHFTKNSNGGAINAYKSNGGTPLALLTLDDVVLSNNTGQQKGGALYGLNYNVTLNNCSVLNNTLNGSSFAFGGGVYVDNGAVNATNSTFSGNSVVGVGTSGGMPGMNMPSIGGGGGLALMGGVGPATFTNCTFTGNTVSITQASGVNSGGRAEGGAIEMASNSSFTVVNCTIANNTIATTASTTIKGGGINIYAATAGFTLTNTIVAANTAATNADVSAGTVTATNNLIGDGAGSSVTNGIGGNLVGTTGTPVDAKLGTLAVNNGTTKTLALLAGSPAINAGTTGGPATDQRGVTRDGTPDIGAYEVTSVTPVNPNPPSAPVTPVTLNSATINVAGTNGNDNILVYIPSGRTDVIRVSLNSTNWNYTRSAVTAISVEGSDGDDVITASVPDIGAFLSGSEGNDTLTGGDASETLMGGNGDDVMYGAGGSDLLRGHAGRDRLYGDDGNDRIYGGTGNDRLNGGAGQDQFWGDAGQDVYAAKDNSIDTLTGLNDNDSALIDDADTAIGITLLL